MDKHSFTPGQQINEPFAVLSIIEKTAASGNKYRNVELSQAGATIAGKIWEDSFATAEIQPGNVYQISGKADVYRGIQSIIISKATQLEEDIENYITPSPTLVFDIETVGKPFEELSKWDQDYLLNNLQKTEEDKEKAKQSTALYPLYGFVASIGMFNPVSKKGYVYLLGKDSITPEQDHFTYKAFSTEKELLEAFWQTANKYPRYVTYNGNNFDWPYLLFRSGINTVQVPFEVTNRQDVFVDLMYKFKMYRPFKLEAICRAFGVTNPKAKGVSGLHVSQLFKDGDIQAIADYVARDVVSTAELYEIWKTYLAGKIIV